MADNATTEDTNTSQNGTTPVALRGRTTPILPSSSFEATARYYRKLGFTTTTRFGDPSEEYLVLAHGDIELHFFSCPDVRAATNDHGAYIFLEGCVDELYAAWHGCGVRRLVPPVDTTHRRREFALTDPDGNLLRIGSPLPAEDVEDH